jgi:hypothetical protein
MFLNYIILKYNKEITKYINLVLNLNLKFLLKFKYLNNNNVRIKKTLQAINIYEKTTNKP